MKKLCVTFIAISCAIVAILGGCSLDPDRKLDKAIDSYNEKKPNALQSLENEFINTISIGSVEETDLQSSGTLLYKIHDNSAEVIYPSKNKYTLTDNDTVCCVDRTSDYAVISDGIKFSIYDGDGDHRNDETIGEKKKPVKAVIVDGDTIIYYKGFKLYRYSIIHNTSESMLKDSFPPPYANHYKVTLSKRDDFICIMSGIAGSYFFNLIQLSTGAVVIKNLAMSSSKYHWGINTIHYTTGNSGNWEIMQYAIDGKVKKSLAKLSDIIDIELVGHGYVLESSTGLWTALYGKEKRPIPFAYRLAGTYKGRIILLYGNSYYFIDFNKLLAGLNKLEEKTPDLFTRSR